MKVEKKEIENYLYDFELIEVTFPEVEKKDYDEIVKDVVDGNVKDATTEIKELCGLEQSSPDEFKIELAKNMDSEMGVYKDLESVIFE
jgi:hypothetical protein